MLRKLDKKAHIYLKIKNKISVAYSVILIGDQKM